MRKIGLAFTSDTHAFHENIIKYSRRLFRNIDEMNKAMSDNINSLLSRSGQLYHLGDWSFRGIENAIAFRKMVRSDIRITLIVGNHDIKSLSDRRFRNLFDDIYDLKEVKVNGQKIVLCHYAMRVWNKSHHGTWHLYGHSHGSLPDDPNSLSFDCGVDCHNFMPLTFEQVAGIMARKTWKPIDHHENKHEANDNNERLTRFWQNDKSTPCSG